MNKIHGIPVFKDNYVWVGVNENLKSAYVVDPGDGQPVSDFLHKNNLQLSAILLTHKHPDHVGGVSHLLSSFPDAPVYSHAAENIAFSTHQVNQGDHFFINGCDKSFNVLHIPGHTLGHVAYYTDNILFSGDTLFSAGCGKVFEGTPAQMVSSLDKLISLPENTLLYCGHEYTQQNLRFAKLVEPENKEIDKHALRVQQLISAGKPSLPSSLELEKKINPFLRCRELSVITSVEKYANKKLSNAVDVFYWLREWKNNFK